MAKAGDELIASARGRWISLATHIEQQLDPTHDPASVTRRVCRDLDEERLPFRYQDAYGRVRTTLPADYGWRNAEINGSSVTIRLVAPEVPDPPPGLSRELMQRVLGLELLQRHNYNPLVRIDAVEVWIADEPIAKPKAEVAASSPPNDALSEDMTSDAVVAHDNAPVSTADNSPSAPVDRSKRSRRKERPRTPHQSLKAQKVLDALYPNGYPSEQEVSTGDLLRKFADRSAGLTRGCPRGLRFCASLGESSAEIVPWPFWPFGAT